MTVTVEYSSNNSGGYWWLTDEDWAYLEKAGWSVDWCSARQGVFRADSDGRWLGALATSATKDVDDPQDAVDEWSRITGQDPSDEGCNCCGQPHNFSFRDENGDYHYMDIVRGPATTRWV